ncbi:hypothetical protein GQ457_16G017560 [Hibiscus cannabinus]
MAAASGSGRQRVWNLFVKNISDRLHWKGLWQSFDRHGVVLDVFIPSKRSRDGTRFSFVCMGAREDALRVIERLDGFWLYGTKIYIVFANREVRNTFWRRRRDISNGVDTSVVERAPVLGGFRRRRVYGEVDDVKMQVLRTCAVRWCRQPLSITRLADEMQSDGLRGIELMWITGSMVLLYFANIEAQEKEMAKGSPTKWFHSVDPWSADIAYETRRAWLSISGLPMHAWPEGSFKNIAGLWGNFVCIDAATDEPVSFEHSRVFVETGHSGRIDEEVEVEVMGKFFSIQVQEVELVRVPMVEGGNTREECERESVGVKGDGSIEPRAGG